jgi:type II secretion system protein H
MNRRRHNFGFTLLELLLVMLLIAVAAAIAAPGFSGFSRGRRLPNTAITLTTTLRWCRVQAIINGTAYRLTLDRMNRQWVVTKDDGTGLFVDVDENEKQGQAYPLPDGIDFGDMVFESTEVDPVVDEVTGETTDKPTDDYVTFKPNGRTDVVTLRLVAVENGHYIDIANDMPMGTFHILSSAEPQ